MTVGIAYLGPTARTEMAVVVPHRGDTARSITQLQVFAR